MADPIDRREIVKWARKLERLRAERRRYMKFCRQVDADIREAQKFLRNLTDDTREVDE